MISDFKNLFAIAIAASLHRNIHSNDNRHADATTKWIRKPFWTWPIRSSNWKCSHTLTSPTVCCVRWPCERIWVPVRKHFRANIRWPVGCQRWWWSSPAEWWPMDCSANRFWHRWRTHRNCMWPRSCGMWSFTHRSISATKSVNSCRWKWSRVQWRKSTVARKWVIHYYRCQTTFDGMLITFDFTYLQVYDGVSHAAKLYPNAYVIMIIIGTLKGNGAGFTKLLERLMRGAWTPTAMEFMQPSL